MTKLTAILGLLTISLTPTIFGYEYPKKIKGETASDKKVKQIKAGWEAKLNNVVLGLAKSGKAGKSYGCCLNAGLKYGSECVNKKPDCFTKEEMIELKCQDQIKEKCELGKAASSLGTANTTQVVGQVLTACVQKKVLAPVCQKNLEGKVVALAKSQNSGKTESNLSRDDVTP